MDESPIDINEKVFYKHPNPFCNDLVTETRLRFGAKTLFLHDITGTEIKIVPQFFLSDFFMSAGIWGCIACGGVGFIWFIATNTGIFSSIWYALLLTCFPFALYLSNLRSGLERKGQLYVTTNKGSVLLTEINGRMPYEKLHKLISDGFRYRNASVRGIFEELKPIQEAISNAMVYASKKNN